MTLKARIIPFVFDWQGFSDDLRLATDQGGVSREVMSQLIGVDHSTLGNWINNQYPQNSYPLVKHFLSACNWMDADPRKYFVLADE